MSRGFSSFGGRLRGDTGAAVMEFVAAPVRQREAVIPIADAREFGGQIR
jgi:hypothetical protein